MMKKILAVVFAIAVVMSLAATAFAAGGPSGQMPGNFRGGMGPMNGQPPEMNGEAPEMNGQPPEMNGEAPEMNGQAPFGSEGFVDFEAMVSEGVLTEDTYESILAYMEEHRPDDLPEMDGEAPEMNGERPEVNGEAPEMNGQPPMMNGEAPDGEAPEGMPERPEMDGENAMVNGLLTDLLNDGVITEEEYEALLAALEA
ncbi:MAG: hypothetical protein K6C08_13305 [Oscillospiraceae bacterium]|nr:hypothetical protein [Oscillospiraceae bacterium]